MRKTIVILFILGFSCFSAYADSVGKLSIDRAWAESIGNFNCSYALVSWENNTDKTFKVVTIQAIAYNREGKKINEAQRSLFAFERGAISPGFKGTLKIPVKIDSEKFDKMEASVIVAE